MKRRHELAFFDQFEMILIIQRTLCSHMAESTVHSDNNSC